MCALMTDLKRARESDRKEKKPEREREKLLPKYNPFTFTVYLRLLVLESTGKQIVSIFRQT